MSIQFTTALMQAEGKQATGIEVPESIMAQLGAGKKPAVSVTVNGYAYRTTVGTMHGKSMLPFSAAHRKASGIEPGDAIEVSITLDTEAREIELPPALAEALDKQPAAQAAFNALAPSRRKEAARQITEAKTEETRTRRLAKLIHELLPEVD